MKLFLFSDPHVDIAAAFRLVCLAGKVDVVLGGGNLANAPHGIFACFKVLRDIHLPTLYVTVLFDSEIMNAVKSGGRPCAGYPQASCR